MTDSLNAGAICNRIVTVAGRDLPVVQAARLMREHHVGCIVVTDDTLAGRRVVGMMTDRDIVTSVVAAGVDPATLVVEDLMSREVVTAREDDSVLDLLAAMRRRGLRRLPVTGVDGVLVGLVTLDDLLMLMAEELRAVALALEAAPKRERAARP